MADRTMLSSSAMTFPVSIKESEANMPVEELKSSVFAVSQPVLKIRPDGARALDFSGSMEIDTYVLCFSKNGPLYKDQVQLSEDEIESILAGKTVQKKDYRLQGVPRAKKNGEFRDFQVQPPEMVQVWAMVRSGSTAVLYIPSEEKSCMI